MPVSDVWVLIRGLLRSHYHWHNFPKQLADQLNNVQVMTPDIPGSGPLYQQDSPLGIEGMVDALRDQVTREYPGQNIKLLGISMGGMMVCEWLSRFSEEVDQAIIINSSLSGLSPLYKRLMARNLFQLMKIATSNMDQSEAQILSMVSNNENARRSVLNHYVDVAKRYPISKKNALRQLAAAATFRVPESIPRCPVLVVSSQGDRLVHPSCSEDIAKHWQAQHVIHPSAGHDIPLDDPYWLVDQIVQFNTQSLVATNP